MLSHFINSTAARDNFDIVHNNLFRVTMIPPAAIAPEPLITEHVMSVTGFTDRYPELVEQQFLQAKRKTVGVAPSDTTQEITILFSLNRNNKKQNYVWNFVKSWRRLAFNPATGETGLKKDYVGTIIVEQFDRKGDIMSTKTYHNAFPTGEIGDLYDLDVTSEEPKQLSTNWHADWHGEDDL